jgi:hypothetical protein
MRRVVGRGVKLVERILWLIGGGIIDKLNGQLADISVATATAEAGAGAEYWC